jgi:hypothetical protein
VQAAGADIPATPQNLISETLNEISKLYDKPDKNIRKISEKSPLMIPQILRRCGRADWKRVMSEPEAFIVKG